jgi:hypothetical protein
MISENPVLDDLLPTSVSEEENEQKVSSARLSG